MQSAQTFIYAAFQIEMYLNEHFNTYLAKPASQQHSPLLEWKQLELVLSDFKTDWCDIAFQTTSLSSLRVISVSASRPSIKVWERVGHPLACIWQTGCLCQYCDLCGSGRDSPIVSNHSPAGTVIEPVSHEDIHQCLGTVGNPLGTWEHWDNDVGTYPRTKPLCKW